MIFRSIRSACSSTAASRCSTVSTVSSTRALLAFSNVCTHRTETLRQLHGCRSPRRA